ncbi:MAG TPA: hypothetical protein VHX60_12925 [Acidobacteriaceae bacterium]|jgi:uncharacterized membrane protein YphA (DoxX/SURF4 family)|nr:hypothetical protein [Acidobacteriaceae bacterium]
MASQAVIEEPQVEVTAPRWSPATRIAFRFCVLYFCLYSLSTQIITTLIVIPNLDLPDPASLPPLRPIIGWTAAHLFHLAVTPTFFVETGSGDRPCDWVLIFCLLVLTIVGTILWSVFDRRRQSYAALRKWFWLFFRIALAGQMFTYGFAKVVPLQMPFPPLSRLLEPFGHFSPMGVLWYSIGASPAYEIFAGSAELLGGILLVIPRTRTLGALICIADMTQVFMLNMTYDVPVKILSFTLILLAILLVAPEFRSILNFFLLDRTAEPTAKTSLFRSLRANRIAAIAQVVFILWLLGTGAYGDRVAWKQYGGGVPQPALYGIWDVEQQTIDGQLHPPLLTDSSRWRRILFDSHDLIIFQGMDDKNVYDRVAIDARANTLTVTPRANPNAKSTFTYARPATDRLVLDGVMDGHKLHMELALYDRNKFLIVSRGFHWVNPGPFNR